MWQTHGKTSFFSVVLYIDNIKKTLLKLKTFPVNINTVLLCLSLCLRPMIAAMGSDDQHKLGIRNKRLGKINGWIGAPPLHSYTGNTGNTHTYHREFTEVRYAILQCILACRLIIKAQLKRQSAASFGFSYYLYSLSESVDA